LQSDASRAAQILMAAGQSCDAAGLTEEAKTCYLLIRSKFPDSVPAQQVAGILRRLHLKGQPLQLAGPTLDGNFVSIEDFKGKTVLVVFWSSQAKPFLDQLPALTELLKKAQKHVSVIGVCLDTDEAELDRFLEEQGLSWPQIFYSEPDKRGWNSPLASYYGITSLPTMWIVDASGVVAETEVAAADLEPKLKDIVRKGLPAKKSAGTGRVQPTGGTSGAE
jgi:peroxiredoxin